ncbi:putative deoxynucleoside kinase [Scale drop disease virus]|nr:putative deoxynucleoside kinase [Scale drop disease virus]QXJ13578.1 ORF125L [Scale drop disease virus]
MKIVSIFGNVGAGKSTLLRSLSSNPKFHIFFEPQQYWDPFFKLYMQNPKEWAAAFQIVVLKGFQELYNTVINQQYDDNDIVVIERSPECSKSFCKWLCLQNQLTTYQFDVICDYVKTVQWFDQIEYVYLKADPKTCAERARARENELNSCPEDYMTFLTKEWDSRHATYVIDASCSSDYVMQQFIRLYDC